MEPDLLIAAFVDPVGVDPKRGDSCFETHIHEFLRCLWSLVHMREDIGYSHLSPSVYVMVRKAGSKMPA